MTAVLELLQLQLVCQWTLPGNHSVINGINYTSAYFSPPLPAFPNLGKGYRGYNEKSADSESSADRNMNGSALRRSPADLPEGYVPFSQHQAAYKVHGELATWNEARERCIAEGGYLAIIDSRDKIAGIRNMNNQSDHWLHVGIYNSADSNQWVRVDNGVAVTTVPWAYEDSNLTGSCAGISLYGLGLVNYLCSGKREHFVCEIPITGGNHSVESSTKDNAAVKNISHLLPPSVDIRPTPSSLPEGYVRFPEDRAAFKIHLEEKSWRDARDTCIAEGARLAIPDSQEKMNRIFGLVPAHRYYNLYLHVGIRKPKTGNTWVLVNDGSPVPSSVPWARGFPDSVGRDRCAGLDTNRNGLINYECAEQESFVCGIPISDYDNGGEHGE